MRTPKVTVSRSGPLSALAADIWQVPAETRQPGGVRMPTNMTIVRLATGLIVVSPIDIDDGLAAELTALGEVRWLVSPSCLHHIALGAATARWPAARVLAPAGLAAKRPDLRIDGALPEAIPEEWRGLVDTMVVTGAPKLGETVLFHVASGTLVCADLVFHVTRPINRATRFVLWLVGAGGGRLAQSRAWTWFTRNRADARAEAARIVAWPIRRIAFGHGEPYDAADVRERLAEALTRMTGSRMHRDGA